jgi:hypothetical protein
MTVVNLQRHNCCWCSVPVSNPGQLVKCLFLLVRLFGTATITYRSRKIKSQHCDTAVVTIPVTAATIDAANDTVALLMELMEILLLECTYISNGNGPIL